MKAEITGTRGSHKGELGQSNLGPPPEGLYSPVMHSLDRAVSELQSSPAQAHLLPQPTACSTSSNPNAHCLLTCLLLSIQLLPSSPFLQTSSASYYGAYHRLDRNADSAMTQCLLIKAAGAAEELRSPRDCSQVADINVLAGMQILILVISLSHMMRRMTMGLWAERRRTGPPGCGTESAPRLRMHSQAQPTSMNASWLS